MKDRVRVLAMIHEHSLGQEKIKTLERSIKSIYQAHFGREAQLVFVWMSIPHGQAYLAGKLSTASTLQIPVANDLPDESRHPFMHEVCLKWMQITGCDKNEIILNAPDRSEANAQFDQFNQKFKPSRLALTQSKMVFRLLKGRVLKGYLTSTINN